jgi:hypothetical protein
MEIMWPIYQYQKYACDKHTKSVKLRPLFSYRGFHGKGHSFKALSGILLKDELRIAAKKADQKEPPTGINQRETSSMFGLLFSRKRKDDNSELSVLRGLLYKQTNDEDAKLRKKQITPLMKYEDHEGRRSLRLLYLLRIPLGGGATLHEQYEEE